MPKDYLPANDDAFKSWVAQFITAATANLAAVHLATTDMTALNALETTFAADLTAFNAAKAAYLSASAAKKAARDAVEADVRMLVNRIQGYNDVSPALKLSLGINPRDSGRTHSEPVTPTTLTATPYSNGVNELFWSRAGNKTNTVFIVEAQIGTASDFAQVGSVTATRFKHTAQTPGVKVVYRVLAQRDGMESMPSNTASVYDTAAPSAAPALRLAA